MIKNLVLATAVSAATLSSAACFEFEHNSTLGPTATGVAALGGSWSSSNLIPSPSTCTDFKWNVTEQTGSTASGSFSATCSGVLKLVGTAQGMLSGSAITWAAQGTATAEGLASCPISLNGTAELTTDAIRVPYTGDTCLGKVSGTENLRRK